MYLPKVIRYNAKSPTACAEQYADIARTIGLRGHHRES